MSELTSTQDRLLRKLLERPIAQAGDWVIPRVPDGSPVSLSPSQAPIWFLTQLYPGSTEYNVFDSLSFAVAPDPERLDSALQTLASRHDALRLRIYDAAGHPVQEDSGVLAPPVVWHDLSDRSAPDADQEAMALAVATTREPFKLDQPPLWRVSAIRLPGGGALLVLVIHHLISDHWSWQQLLQELTSLLAGNDPGPAPTTRFVDYVSWLSTETDAGRRQADLRFWTEALAGDLPVLQLPADRPRASVPSRQGRATRVVLPPELSARARRLADEQGTTLFTVLLAAYNVFLARLSGQDDVIVGTALAGRDHPAAEQLVGCFVRLVPLRARYAPESSYRDVIDATHRTVLEAHDHQSVPYTEIVAALNVPRDLSVQPVVQTYFGMQTAETLHYPGAEVGPMALMEQNGTGRWDLCLTLTESPSRLEGIMDCFADLFDQSTLERFSATFALLVESLLADPDRPVSRHSLVAPAEQDRILTGLNTYQRPQHSYSTLAQPFEEQAGRTPDAVAVDAPDAVLTYRELDERANRLAHHLQSIGAGRGGRVALLLDRSAAMVEAVYAVAKSGAAYVPLDTELPDARLAFMFDDTAPAIVVTDRSGSSRVPEGPWQVVNFDTDRSLWAGHPTSAPVVDSATNHFSHLLYTSGSTGRPKAVAAAVDGAVAELLWAQDRYPYGPGDATLFLTSYGFDVSLLELFWPLYFGARLVVVPPGAQRDVDGVRAMIDRHRVTGQWMVPTMLHAYLEGLPSDSGRSLRWVFSGGEPVTPALRDAFYASVDARLVNLYGPTETGGATDMVVPPEPGCPVVPLGRPAANFRVYLLDEDQQVVPIGVPAEAYIAGEVGITHGYFNRPRLTAERYVPDPFGPPGGRMYRTGDICRYRANGVLEHLGRIGTQVKVRGMRVELAEIEAVLAEHHDVAQCVVLPAEANGTPGLAAFVVARPGAPSPVAGLAEHAGRMLPRHMVPTWTYYVDAIPINVNGKVDRRVLLNIHEGRAAASSVGPDGVGSDVSDNDAPADEIEEAIARIFCELLSLPKVGVDDSFFELGGHSLLIFRLIAACGEELGFTPDVADVFTAPTVRELADNVRQGRSGLLA